MSAHDGDNEVSKSVEHAEGNLKHTR